MSRKGLWIQAKVIVHKSQKLRAKRQNKPEAEVIRELVSEGLKTASPARQESTGASLLRLAAIGGKGPADLSTRIDDYLYGEDN